MSRQTNIERLAAARASARTAPTLDSDAEDDARAHTGELGGAWTVGSVVAGRFVLQQRLGRGRYGPIYKALDRSLPEELLGVEHCVALQDLNPRIATRTTLIERLEQLSSQPQSWSHPNIAKVVEFGRDGNKFYLCEELLEGVSLRYVLDSDASEALAYDEVHGILRAVGDALSYGHAKGIVHGELRPENVFVTDAYKVKLLDFIPCTEPRLAPFYPEDPDTGNQPHPSDDVYGLACLAYELLTGRHPYNGNSPLEALRAGLAAPAAPNLPPLRWQALTRGLALRREQRTANVQELLAGLGVTGTETLRPPPRGTEPTRVPSPRSARPANAVALSEVGAEPAVLGQRSQRSRTRAILVAVLAVLTAAVATFAYFDYTRSRLPGPTSTPGSDAAAGGAQVDSAPQAAPASEAPPDAPTQGAQSETVVPTESPAGDGDAARADDHAAAPTVTSASLPRFEFAERTVTVSESEASARIVIRRTASQDAEASVVWWTTDGTALADEDFAVLGARIENFAIGAQSRVIHVPLIADSKPEPRETFVVNLGTGRAGAESAAQIEIVVRDDDA